MSGLVLIADVTIFTFLLLDPQLRFFVLISDNNLMVVAYCREYCCDYHLPVQ
jgi:hypothetical protein